ncbi:MAG TPA: putative baseplate assembly protein [Geminicoccaceae bacterium]|nr:putative baseplate assembly protein [Geminicoccaceae bacterium]
MPLPRFTLADLTPEQMVAELLRRLPAHTPEWTNPQPGDPGRTLIELFAWLADSLLYRADLVPERQRLEFLRLLDIGLRPARPASGLAVLAPADPAAARAVPVPLGTPVDGPLPFETTGAITAQPFEARAFIKRKASEGERAATGALLQDLAILYGIAAGEPYVTTPLFTDGQYEPAGLDPFATSVDQALWLALLAPAAEAREGALAALDDQPALLNVGFVPRLAPADSEAPPPDLADLWQWEATTRPRRPDDPLGFTPLEVEQDTTGGLARPGTLRLLLPSRAAVFAPADDVRADFRAGVGPRPPRLDDPDLQARLLFWLRLRPAGGGDALPMAWLGVNAVEIDQRRTLRDTVVGTGAGFAAQELALPGRSIDPASLVLEVEESGRGFIRWPLVPDLAALSPDDRGFELDPEAGVVRFGDGVRGRLPQTGARIAARSMRYGGGAAGNLPQGALTGIAVGGLTVTNPAPLAHGAEAESVDQALRRIPSVLRHGERCVTAQDYRDLALATPGADIGRVEVLPRFRPFQRRLGVNGSVSVMVLPGADVPKAPNPRPGRILVEQVRQELEGRRPLATELFVIGPEYRGLGVSAALGVREGFARDRVARAVREALALYLWPLAPGGRDGTGWPLGQAVSNLELEVVVARTAGVQRTGGVLLFVPDPAGFRLLPREPGSGAQELRLDPWQLPELLAVELAVGSDRPPETLAALPPGTGTDEGVVPIPVVPEVC